MKHIVMGTSGHVDHGKTSLVKCLTGIDTDRLKEEQERGMTIQLGFAPMKLDEDIISIVDVPGHEKLIKTMVSGAGGIDFVLMVIAADEGVMPQTLEHIDVLTLLGIHKGIIALTKIDKLSEEALEDAIFQITKELQGTFLENTKIVPVSTKTGHGIEELKHAIIETKNSLRHVKHPRIFRMPVDRVFSLAGHGTIVTGTIWGGKVKKGDEVEILPGKVKARVRSIQIHNNSCDYAIIGHRCALNLSIDKENVIVGDVIAAPHKLLTTELVDVSIVLLENASLPPNGKIRFHIGTKEVTGTVKILGADNDEFFAQIKLSEPVVAVTGDRFIIRSYSPVETIGGGRVISHITHKALDKEKHLSLLKQIANGDLKALIYSALEFKTNPKGRVRPKSMEEIAQYCFEDEDAIANIIEKEVKKDKIMYVKRLHGYMSKESFTEMVSEIKNILRKNYRANQFSLGIKREELKSKHFPDYDSKILTELINTMVSLGIFKQYDGIISEKSIASELYNIFVQIIDEAFEKSGAIPPNLEDIRKLIKVSEIDFNDIITMLVIGNKLVHIDENAYIHKSIIDQAQQVIEDTLESKGEVSTSEFRDKINTNRKYAVAILEYFDKLGLTKREGDTRIKGKGLAQEEPQEEDVNLDLFTDFEEEKEQQNDDNLELW